ncbi:metalloregulator ArsR/SmtB family transcription factor [Roseivivax sediminis]|uniref:Transcriptional regulator, ArsR family n=1 Tax=Roseivivax sediminis TaxID=936889 RepID=A0A1I2D8T2_9RHOB|nr:metalloregulator ArsR/SmtB family transcription factor [Roseivivax sediminis]SFE76935.1 transcriptional regulator, ArsR family [Roseivivax sediminis]
MEERIVPQLAALAHPARLSVFRLLIRRAPDALRAGEIAAVLGLPASTLSAHLSHLRQAGLIAEARSGTARLYRADVEGAAELVETLVGECCRGRVASCIPWWGPLRETRDMSDRRYTALFICTGNSARSIFAEALLRDLGRDRFDVHSAGTKPFSELNPLAVALLRDKGHDVSRLRSKTIAEFQGADAPQFDFVFTVCDRAANEECPAWPGQPVSAHWGQPDPVAATGTEAERMLAFQSVYGGLRNRIQAFLALPLEALDRATLQRRVDDIARLDDTESA